MQLPILLLILSAGMQAGSDVHLKGAVLKRFFKTGGASHLGRTVRWDVKDSVFAHPPLRKAGGYALHAWRGVGILVRLSDPGLREVIRRGGRAILRGRMRRTPPRKRRKNEPRYYLDVRSVTRRKK